MNVVVWANAAQSSGEWLAGSKADAPATSPFHMGIRVPPSTTRQPIAMWLHPRPATGRVYTALRRLAALAPGWDGRRAPAPSAMALSNARRSVEIVESAGITWAKLVADVDGGVMITVSARRRAARYAALACDNDGSVTLVLESPEALPRAQTLRAVTSDVLAEAVEEMFAFVLS